MLFKTKIRYLFLTFSLTAILFTACNNPMGMGPPIDWEAPVLSIDQDVSKPIYVRKWTDFTEFTGTKLTGKVTDNVGVERVIFTNTATGEELFPVIREGNNWSIKLKFVTENNNENENNDENVYHVKNGDKIVSEIRAYDKMSNSDEGSVVIVTMIIDIEPPVVENVSIQRTDTRIARLEYLRDLKLLETTDPLGEKKDDLFRYQNGWFAISGTVNEEETKIEEISLDFYDVSDLSNESKSKTLLLSLPVDNGYTKYFPRWTVKEEDIINAGERKWANYKSNYYVAKERYYYSVVVKATDSSGNKVEEEKGCICLFAKSDEPKGILDIGILQNGTVSRGTPLPIDFYDDDSLLWAYTGLLTYEQWYGQRPVFGTVKITGETDDERLSWLKNRLRAGDTVYDWKFDKHDGLSDSEDEIKELIKYNPTKSIDEKTIYLLTGNGENDYGDYVVFTFAADRKLSPHDGKGPENTNKQSETQRLWHVAVIDENVPLIVFDTSNGCPEENTFPLLTNGEYFSINGYTLRENASGDKKVITFRVAWVPYGMDGGPDDHIEAVQNALRDKKFTSPAGVQYWDFMESGIIDNTGVSDPIDNFEYLKQSFTKEFSVLGKTDDTNGLKNFTYKGKLENETKLFVFYAVDNMGHEVFRQMRLLGMKIPPTLSVYDISNKVTEAELPKTPYTLPDPNTSGNIDQTTGGVTQQYFDALNLYNRDTTVYDVIKGKSTGLTSTDETIPFQIYPRGTTLKYWIKAAKSEKDIAITDICMTDITFASSSAVIGNYNGTDMAYTYCESFPDVTQRTFLIEATDALGNVAQIQRTIAVTNAAKLESITTTREDGTYGIGEKIILTAKFSNQIYVDGGGIPLLNIRYQLSSGGIDGWRYANIECKNPPNISSPRMNLEFEFNVPEGSLGALETLYDDDSFKPSDFEKRPVIVPTGRIMDSGRKDAAFLPGYVNESVSVPNWTAADEQSLQKTKNIRLDGVRPVVKSPVIVSGKDPYPDTNQYFFKKDETVLFSITASKPVMAYGTPALSYTDNSSFVHNNVFAYQRPGGNDTLVFALPINADNCRADGFLTNIILKTDKGLIIDDVRNSVNEVNISNLLPSGTYIYIKQNPPFAPDATLAGEKFGTTPDNIRNYNTSPILVIPLSPDAYVNKTEYSLDGGYSWTAKTYNAPTEVRVDTIPPGTHNLMVRYVDRAGNESPEHRQRIQVKDTFPKLIQVSAKEPNGWYTAGNNLTFNLAFEEPVKVTEPQGVSITIWNRAATVTSNDGKIKLDVAPGQTALTSTIKFNWTGINGKEMRDGLYIEYLEISGLSDGFGNKGGSGAPASYSDPLTITTVGGDTYTCPNLPYTDATRSIKVDAVNPLISDRNPDHNTQASSDTSTITLTFNEPVQKGSGIITIRPRGEYSIPPVFANEGYYSNGTYISSFYDIYTNSALNAVDRNYLTVSVPASVTTTSSQTYDPATGAPAAPDTVNPSMTRLYLNQRTGQSYGPYIKTTHGLIAGRGYTGDYDGTDVTSGPNAPDASGNDFMIPDTATKWVLDYKYKIDETTGAVANIRNVLTKAKFRWQEIDVVNTSIGIGANANIVTITLNEPLLRGLEWDVYYPAGAFTDLAGNPAAVCGNNDYHFISYGVQPPVIRVNRRSFDARNGNWSSTTNRTYDDMSGDTQGWNSDSMIVNNNGLAADGGWKIGDFNYVHYRVESESIGATIQVKAVKGDSTNKGGAIGSYAITNNVSAVNPGATTINDIRWDLAYSDTVGTWVLSNIITRSRTANDQIYTIINRNGMPESRISNGQFRMFKSYNRDLKKSELDGIILSSSTNGYQGVIDFDALEASKSYVVASAKRGSAPEERGYEGVFRTIIIMNLSAAGNANNFISVSGSNIKNGTNSIAGFPTEEGNTTSGDNRFLKAFYHSGNRTQYYWVSTEIVSEWYYIGNRNNGGWAAFQHGDVNNHYIVGYGDMTYCLHGN